MRTPTNGWRAVVLTGLLLLTGAVPLDAGPEGRPEVPPEVRQEYRERMRALHGEFRSRLRSLKAKYRARRQALRAEFEARDRMQSPQTPPGPSPESPTP